MKLTQILTRSSLVAIAFFNLSLAAVAEPIIVTRGTHGAARIVDSNNIPIDAKPVVNNKVGDLNEAKPTAEETKKPQLTRRGTHGAFVLSSK